MMFKEILSAFGHLKVHYSTDGFEMRFFWSFIFESKPTIAAPWVIFWFRGEDSFGLWIVVSIIPRLLSNNVCKTTFKSIPTLHLSKIWTRNRQASCYRCFEDKIENFTIHKLLFTDYCSQITVHRLLFTVTIHFYCSWYCSLRIFAYLRGVVP